MYEAGGLSVNFRGTLWQEQHPVVIIEQFQLKLTDADYNTVLTECIRYANLSYGALQLLGIGAARLFNLTKNPFSRGDSRQVCSELVLRILEKLGTISPGELSPDLVTPKQLWQRSQHALGR